MKAIQFTQHGAYENLKLIELPAPDLLQGQLLVKVNFAAINPVDNTIRAGLIPQAQRLPMILGNEAAGIVVKGNNQFPNGTRVIISAFTPAGAIRGIASDGAWQSHLALYPEELIKTPANLSDQEAASVFVGFFSAQACLNKADFAPGKTVLSLAVGGAVGNAGVQLAKAHGASLVITTAGSASKAKAAELAGFENVINLENESINEGVMRITGGKGVDIVIDSVGGNLTGNAIKALARNGIIVNIGYSAGAQFTANITDFVWKGLQMRGQSLSGWFTAEQQQYVWNQLLPLLANGSVKPTVAKVFDAADAPEAQRYLIEEKPFGKVLIKF
ncbi:zinc-binding alcohol dehydrogenase family protein [Mucilaginibacter gossypii]|uniref:quinone oxidoreductase family protein n=1 Tax=Mucilaginibacter gossypii TaxID=551996 RepID=UPI001676EFDC|nr:MULTISPECIES: zinc-binding alcohol dehydrogenase family protein [Mucilaginibacter]QTE39077.1 zinc-binding alcohol dehydrogenase family protein [Mucilaginibacter gossypii]